MPVLPVHHHTRASCAARRSAGELCGGTGVPSAPVEEASDSTRPRGRGSAPPGRGLRILAVALLVLGGIGCVDQNADGTEGATEVGSSADPFENAQPSIEHLGRNVLAALARQDTAVLQSFRLTEREHNDVVWPELPASAPEVNYPLDLAWENIELRNWRGLQRIMPLYANRQLGFEGVECRGQPEAFETFVVETDCYVVFGVDASPQRWEAQIFKDALRRGGGFKIFRYYDEEPRPYTGRASQ